MVTFFGFNAFLFVAFFARCLGSNQKIRTYSIYIYSIQISVCGGGQPVHVNAALLFSRREHFISSTGVAI